jgi:ribosome-associated toxin RatA of RatAB toxin-antitoxin module
LAEVQKSALVPHSAGEMYALVNDVESYVEFLPWCRSSRVVTLTEEGYIGEIVVAKAGIVQSFQTRNIITPETHVGLTLEEGPFKHLHGDWNFTALREDASKVELRLEFEFSGRLMNAAFGAVFSQIANSMVDAFCKRAGEVYGK